MGELFTALLIRCVSPAFAALTKAIHGYCLKLGSLSDLHLATRMLVALSKCGVVEDACQLFEEIPAASFALDIVPWNAIISGCVRNGRDELAFQYFKRIHSGYSRYNCGGEGLMTDSYTLSSLLSSTHCLKNTITSGEQLHGYCLKTGLLSSISVGNALITFYAAWRRLVDASSIFASITQRNIVSWTALISGYARQQGHEEESLKLFVLMANGDDGLRPNQFTFASVIGACASLAWLSQGMALKSLAFKMGLFFDIHIQNALISFYSECGCLDSAELTFKAIIEPDIVSWNSLLKGYSQQGRGTEALRILDQMIEVGVLPDSVSFVSVLSACSHSGMASHGLELFKRMEREYGICPRNEHVSCIISLLGRAGKLHEAADFILAIPFDLSSSAWRTLMGACRVHGSAEEIAEWAVAQLLEREPGDAESNVVLSNIYASSGRWDMVRKMRCLMKDKGVTKDAGSSWIEVGNRFHSFVSFDWGHPQMEEMRITLIELTNNIKKDEHALQNSEA
ncbi:hypothetical protein ACLOJK_014055 [Asimina triloba]